MSSGGWGEVRRGVLSKWNSKTETLECCWDTHHHCQQGQHTTHTKPRGGANHRWEEVHAQGRCVFLKDGKMFYSLRSGVKWHTVILLRQQNNRARVTVWSSRLIISNHSEESVAFSFTGIVSTSLKFNVMLACMHTHSSKADAIPLPDIYKQPFALTVFYMLPWKHVCICDSVSTGCSTWHYCSYWLHSVDSLTQHSTSLFNTSCGTCDFTQTGTFVWNSLQQKAAGSKLCKSVRIIYLMCPFFVLLNMTLSHSLRKSRFSGHQALPKDAHRLKMAVSLFPEIGF